MLTHFCSLPDGFACTRICWSSILNPHHTLNPPRIHPSRPAFSPGSPSHPKAVRESYTNSDAGWRSHYPVSIITPTRMICLQLSGSRLDQTASKIEIVENISSMYFLACIKTRNASKHGFTIWALNRLRRHFGHKRRRVTRLDTILSLHCQYAPLYYKMWLKF